MFMVLGTGEWPVIMINRAGESRGMEKS